jgi:Family of unknown function (DUF5683)
MKMPEVSNNYSQKKASLLLLLLLSCALSFAQKNSKTLNPIDTTPVTTKIIAEKTIDATKEINKDTLVKKHSPKIAATRSAIFPGLGQIYNKKYWKLPIVYGALGVTTYIFIDNIKTYKEYRFAYNARYKAALPSPRTDSTDYFKLENIYKIIQPESIKAARNKFRQYVDYSVLFFILFWGLNVVDATVDAHLKSFDVSPNLSLSINPGRSQMAGTNGVSLVLHIGKK